MTKRVVYKVYTKRASGWNHAPPLRFFLLLLAVFGLLQGCASIPSDYRDPRDPWESYNRAMAQFNDHFDRDIFKPIATGYKRVTPAPLDKGITNFFENISDFSSAINNLLQAKPIRASSDVGRIVINTTLGLLGFFDVASHLDLQKYGEDFGQTLGYWGVGPGPYFVLPFLGPSSLRDATGKVVDWKFTNALNYIELGNWRYALTGLKAVDTRAGLLSTTEVLQEAALDPYEFMRDAYLQKRLSEVYDGNPPQEEFDFDDEDFLDPEFDDLPLEAEPEPLEESMLEEP